MARDDYNNGDDDLIFAEEDPIDSYIKTNGKWKIIISDDEAEVHNVTKMVLKNTVYKGKELDFYHAYSGEETKTIIKENPDTALLLLDVVMEEDDTGLKIIKYIREYLHNNLIRIVIRTGQPGEAPERKVIVDYDINDYKEKAELTSQKLFSTVIASLRSFDNLVTIDNNKRSIEQVLRASNLIFKLNSTKQLIPAILRNINKFFLSRITSNENEISGFIAVPEGNSYKIEEGIGRFNENHPENLPQDFLDKIKKCPDNTFDCHDNISIGKLVSSTNDEIDIYIEKDKPISDEERDILNIFGINIINTYNRICLNVEIENTQREMLYTLGEVVESRSNETGYHVKRVAEYSHLIALKYGLSPEEAEILKKASPMHDIGKVGIIDKILNKPGRLTDEEFEEIKKHTTIGYDIFKKSHKRILQAAAIIALQHHERYNGLGYPNGLKGEEIHIYGRITCLTDVFDAVGSNRVYKKAWELDDTLEYIKNERGQTFDPVLVDIFFDNLDEILTIRDLLKD